MRRLMVIAALALGFAIAALLVWVAAPSRTAEADPDDAPGRPGGPPGAAEGQTTEPRDRAGAPSPTTAGASEHGGADARADEGRAPDDLFRRKLEQDRLVLGPERHGEMERLWSEGRKQRGDRKGIEDLERLLREYPNTNRAGCAAWELGHQYVRSRDHDLRQGREQARRYWQDSIDRYGGSICEHNVSVGAHAKLGLAAWVYRYTDRDRARKLLHEVIEERQQEVTPNDRTPPAVTARRLLENLAAGGSDVGH